MRVLMLGSGPSVLQCRDWQRAPFDRIVAINNAWAVRPDWDDVVFPEDFPAERQPPAYTPHQRAITADIYLPANNAFGGVIYAGATMAFTAGYWALHALRPTVLAYLGCDMVYAPGRTHFYGTGTADPLRADPTLQDLHAKSARLELLAAREGCAVVNLSTEKTRLSFPRATPQGARHARPRPVCGPAMARALDAEAALGAVVPSGRYWETTLDAPALGRIDALWTAAWQDAQALRSA
ncbi:MAG: hypothetical protein ACXIUV_15745 [Alkalilacustris sp.]